MSAAVVTGAFMAVLNTVNIEVSHGGKLPRFGKVKLALGGSWPCCVVPVVGLIEIPGETM